MASLDTTMLLIVDWHVAIGGKTLVVPPPLAYGPDRQSEMKKRLETQTLHTGCTKVETKKFRPAADPLPGGAGW